MIVLNIGMQRNDGGSHTAAEIVTEARQVFDTALLVRTIAPAAAGEEWTAILVVEGAFNPGHAVNVLARALHQDCIACYWPAGRGQGRLMGPKADAWGAFDARLFTMPNGERLA